MADATYPFADFPAYRFARIGMSQSQINGLALQWAALPIDLRNAQGMLIESSPDAAIPDYVASFPPPLDASVSGVVGVNPPTNPVTNDLWYNAANDVWERWNGSAWTITGGGGGVDTTARAAAATAQSTASTAVTAAAAAATSASGAATAAATAISTVSSAVTAASAASAAAAAATAAASAATTAISTVSATVTSLSPISGGSREPFIVCGADADPAEKAIAHIVSGVGGYTDQTAAAALFAAMYHRPVVSRGSFVCTAALMCSGDNIDWDGYGSTFYSADVVYPAVGIHLTGSRTDTGMTLASSGTFPKGSQTYSYATITTAPAAGDRLAFVAADTTTSSQPFGGTAAERPGESMSGEWQQVAAIDTSAKVITLRGMFHETYDLTKNFKIYKYNLIKKPRVKGVKFVSPGGVGHPITTNAGRSDPTNREMPFHISYADDPMTTDVEIDGAPYARHGIGFFECLTPWVIRTRGHDVNDTAANSAYEAYLIRLMGCLGGYVSGTRSTYGSRHAVEVNGGQSGYGLSTVTRPIGRYAVVENNDVYHTWAAGLGDHPGSEFSVFRNNRTINCSGGIFVRGHLSRVDGHTMIGGHHLVGPYGAVLTAGVTAGSAVTATVDATGKLTAGSTFTLGSGLSTSETVTVSSITDSTHVVLATVANTHAIGEVIGSAQGNDHMVTVGEQIRDTSGANNNTTRGGWCGTGFVLTGPIIHDMTGNGSPFASTSHTVLFVHPADGASVMLQGTIKPTGDAIRANGDYCRDSRFLLVNPDMSNSFSNNGRFVNLNPLAQSPTTSTGQYVRDCHIEIIGGVKPRTGGVYIAGSADSANPSDGNQVIISSRTLGSGLTSASALLELGTNPNGGVGYHGTVRCSDWATRDINYATAVSRGGNSVNNVLWSGVSQFADTAKTRDGVILATGMPRIPKGSGWSTVADSAATHGIAFLYRVQGTGQHMTKATVYCSSVGASGADYGYRVAAYADDGSNEMPTGAPLIDAGRIQVTQTAANSNPIDWYEPIDTYWVSTNMQYDTLPPTFHTMATLSNPDLLPPIGGVIPSGTAVSQARFRKMTGAGSGSTAAAPTLSGLVDDGTARIVGCFTP